MNFGYSLTGSASFVKRYKLGVSSTTAGVPFLVNAAGSAGCTLAAVEASADFIGVSTDVGTYSTTQGDAEGLISIVINPDAVYRIKMTGATAAGTVLVLTTNDVAETAGTVIDKTGATGVSDPDPNSPTMDEGTVFCVSGANAGQSRKVTSVGATAATVTVPFLNDILSGDEFIIVPWTPMDVAGNDIRLSSNLQEGRQNSAVGTGNPFRIIDLDWGFPDRTSVRDQSYVIAIIDDHILKDLT